MRLGAINNVNFGEKCIGNGLIKEKRSLIDGRPLARNELIDDVFEFCTKLKESGVLKTRKPLTFTDMDKEYISGLPVGLQVPRLMKLINSKNG